MPSSPLLRFVFVPGVALALLSGCASTSRCNGDTDYLAAQDRPRLQLPEGVAGSERLGGGLVIPPPVAEPAKLDPAPKCLDEPPPYFSRKPGTPPRSAAPPADPEQPAPPTPQR